MEHQMISSQMIGSVKNICNFFLKDHSLCHLVILLLLWANVNAQAQQSMSFLAVSDIHLNINKRLSNENSEDTDSVLWGLAIKKIRELLNSDGMTKNDRWHKPSFLLCLGDLPLHGNDTAAKNCNSNRVSDTLKKLAKEAGVPTIFTPGNNDPEKGSYRRLPDSTLCTASYPLDTGQKLKVLALNSVIFTLKYANNNKDSVKIQSDTALELLKKELKQAADAKYKVLIIMHIPPGWDANEGKNMWDLPQNYDKESLTPQNTFLKIIVPYQQTIVGILASHTHMDGLRLIYDEEGNSNNVLISVPSIDPGHGNNPALKLFTFNSHTFEITDCFTFYYTYYLSRKVANWENNSYSFREVFGCSKDVPIRRCIQELLQTDPTKIKTGNREVYKVCGRWEAKDNERADSSMQVTWQKR